MQRALVPLLAAVVLSSGCYSVKLYSQENLSAPTSDSHMQVANSFFWGLVATNRIDVDRACGPAGYKTIRSQMGGWTVLGNWVTLGIWSPMQVRIKCAQGPVATPPAVDAP
jgi:hypothetical protein